MASVIKRKTVGHTPSQQKLSLNFIKTTPLSLSTWHH